MTLNSPLTRRHNLPIQPTPLIGREALLQAACKQLLSGEVRLLTLTGPPGAGRLARGERA
jgi:hypothetical protein